VFLSAATDFKFERNAKTFCQTENMKMIFARLFFILVFSIFAVNQAADSSVQAQNSDVKPKGFIITDKEIPVVKPSNLIENLRKKKNENPKMSARELADYGNEILKKEGYDYTFSWEPKGQENEKNLSKMNFEDYYPFKFRFTDSNGSAKQFQLMNDGFEHPCYSVIDVPLTKINEQTITVISENIGIELKRPKEFYLEEFALVDKTLKKTIRKWKTPIDATPVGISKDGTKVYFDSYEFYQDSTNGFEQSPINLVVEISGTGNLRLVDKNEIESGKGVQIDYDKKHTEIIYEKYKVGNKEYIIKYSAPCT
jgi:hypothetical protein